MLLSEGIRYVGCSRRADHEWEFRFNALDSEPVEEKMNSATELLESILPLGTICIVIVFDPVHEKTAVLPKLESRIAKMRASVLSSGLFYLPSPRASKMSEHRSRCARAAALNDSHSSGVSPDQGT